MPPDPAGLFSEGSEVIELHEEGSVRIPIPGIFKGGITVGKLNIVQVLASDQAAGRHLNGTLFKQGLISCFPTSIHANDKTAAQPRF